jgi:DNA-binding winged helix-turn-helix (wHTH) protein
MFTDRQPSPGSLLFGPFELNAPAGELRKAGVPVRVSGQPIQILATLLAHAGEVVTRDQLRSEVWGEVTFVDFEHGLNAAINKLRRALGDSAESPRYIETVPGRGYRFIGEVTGVTSSPERAKAATDVPLPVSATAPAVPPKWQPARQWHSRVREDRRRAARWSGRCAGLGWLPGRGGRIPS